MAKNKPKNMYSDAFFIDNLVLRHERAQHVYDRCGVKVIDALFGIAVILPNISKTREVDDVSAIVKKTIEDAFMSLRTESARVEKLLVDNGVTIKAQYSNPKNIAVRVTSPRAGAFVALLRILDDLLVAMDKLWFAEVWDEAQKRRAEREVANRVLGVSTQIFALHKRAHLARQRKEPTVAPVTDSAIPVAAATPEVPVGGPAESSVTKLSSSEVVLDTKSSSGTPSADPAVETTAKQARRKRAVAT